MATRDRREQVLRSLAELATTSGDPPVILVDNGSTDGTAEAVAAQFPRVTVLALGRNTGAPARTLGVQAAGTPYVAFADDDSWWADGALDLAAASFDAHPRLGLLAARILVGPQERDDPVCLVMAQSPLPLRADLPGPAVLGFVACGAVVRRQAYLDAGGFSPVLFFLGEEDLLAWDLAAAGWGLAYVAAVVAHHHPRPGAERAGRHRLQRRNALLSCWLRRPLPVVARQTSRALVAARDPEARGALLDAARRLPRVLAERRVLPAWLEADLRLLRAGGPAEPPPPVPHRAQPAVPTRGGDPRVAVVVITHNRADELGRALTRLAALPERPRVVVVDNGSTDGTAALVRRDHPTVILVPASANLGAVGRNLGVALLSEPYVAFCDDDTWWEPGSLCHAADLLDAHPDLAVLTARIIVEPHGRTDAISHEMAASPLPHPSRLPGTALLSFLAGASVLRRTAFLEAGGFSARLWLGGEEELLASHLATAGWHMAYVEELVVHHRASKARDAHLRRRHGIRNTLWFTWLRRPLPSALRRTWKLLGTLPPDAVTARGVLDAVRGAGWVLAERSVVPPHVEQGYQSLEQMQLRGGARRYVS